MMVLSRAAFGVRGNALPTLVSYLILVGWETRPGRALHAGDRHDLRADGNRPAATSTSVIAFLATAALIVAAGVLGFETTK